MIINLNFKKLITFMLIVAYGSVVTANTIGKQKDLNSLAPETTVAESTISFWDLPYLKKSFIDSTPADRKDGLAVSDLGENGGNKDRIVKLAQEIADEKHGKYDSMLISHQGKLVFESYYLRGRVNLPHLQASATKAYTSLAVGRAIQLGYITLDDLHKPLVSFLKDLDPTKFIAGVEKITLHKAMTMSSGLRFSDEQIKEFGDNPKKFKGLDQIQAFLELSAPINSGSQIYHYQSPDPIMIMQVLDAVVPGSAKDFIKNELLNKIGINNYNWQTDLSGLPKADERSSMTSRDMIKLGSLVIKNGKWNGEQLISAKYLANATSKMTKAIEEWQPDSFNYGYFFYQTDIKVGDKSYETNMAWGNGGQRIITVKEFDLVIVFTGHDREDTIMTQVSKIILPAFIKDEFPVPKSSTPPKYETYNYSGFTKEESYAFHKHIYEGGDWTEWGDKARFYYLNFSEIKKHSRILRSDTPKILEEKPRADVKNFMTSTDLKKGGGLSLNDYVQQVEVNGLIIIHKGKIVFEGYPRMFPTDLHINMLITQVFVSTAIAILEDRGLIDTSKPIDDYFAALKNSGWKGVPIIDILAMSSGIDRIPLETYEVSFDPIKDLATAKSAKPSGTEYQFSNIDAAILTLLVEKMSGLRFRDFVEQEIWRKIGSEHSALLGINTNGTSISYADGMSTTLRDLARFGLAFTPSGRKNANPIISDAHLSKIRNVNKNLNISRDPNENKYSSYQWGAVYDDGDFYKGAHGGQGLYISPTKDLVIAYFGTANTDRERNQLDVISRQLVKSGLFDLE